MTRALALSLGALLAGCGGNSNVQLNSVGSSAGGASGGTSLSVQSGTSSFGKLLAIGVLVGMSYGSDRELENAGARPGYGPGPAQRVPELDPSRRVVVQDCTRPIEDWSANVKCR